MREMYANADQEGKASLSKAWEDGREKRERGQRTGKY